jgi:disulfide bond formation protein DsbB|tara:strand:+ start:561 stop:1061 length:501 start_codon:yes stop_codon:yes gene_type:complete
MLNQKNNTILVIIFFIILLSIISALIIEYVLGHQPCNLCLYERIPYFLSTLLIIKIFFFKKYEKITLFILFLVFMSSSLLAFYHFGIEQGFFSESFVCNAKNQLEILSKEQLLKELNQKVVSCKEVTFRIFGFSLAALNTILSVVLSFIFLKLFLNYGSSSTSQYK